MKNQLDDFRKQIDKIDNSIIDLLAERMRVVKKVGQYKKSKNIPPLDANRWQKVVETRKILAQKIGLNGQFIEKIWQIIHDQALEIEKNI